MAIIRVLLITAEIKTFNINNSYIDELGGFEVVGIGANRDDVFALLDSSKPDLVIIDDNLSDVSSTEIISFARLAELPIDFILTTTATNSNALNWALRHGVIDYILKPFQIDRFTKSLLYYRELKRQLSYKLTSIYSLN